LDTELKINSTWATIRDNTKISAKDSAGFYQLIKRKPWLNQGCLTLLQQGNQAGFQWL
jgi:hypothetical protein